MTIRARRLASSLEPFVGSVYFAPECHAAYAAMGFAPSPKDRGGVPQPDISAYFTSRAASMGRVRGHVAAGIFAVFEPQLVIRGIDLGWSLTDPATIARVRVEGAAAQLNRLFGAADHRVDELAEVLESMIAGLDMAGRPLASGLVALGPQGGGWMRLHWAADVLREYRGDCHTAAWVNAGLSAPEICLLGDPYRGLAPRTYSRSRGWSHEALDEAERALRGKGLWDDSGMTEDGLALRESIEVATDRSLVDPVDALAAELETVIETMREWDRAIIDGKGYPADSPLFREG